MKIQIFEKIEKLEHSETDILYTSVNFNEDKKEVFSFCIIQFIIMKKKFQVIKYDSSHEQCHVHKYYSQNSNKENINYSISPETIKILKKDIKTNWKKYKKKFIKNKEFNNI